jgi:hypothetical protein
MTIDIAEYSNSVYNVIYSLDHCNSFEITKSNGVMQFGLPIVNNTSLTEGRLINEKSDTVSIGGINAQAKISFEIPMSGIKTCLDLVNNRYDVDYKISVNDWSGDISTTLLYGIFDNVRIRQEGGDPRLTCDLSFLEGANIMKT